MTAKALIFAATICLRVFGQSGPPGVVVRLEGLRYPPIAAQARIGGDVIFETSGAEHKLVFSANPLLAPAAEDNLKRWTLPATEGKYAIVYNFSLLDFRVEVQDRPIGNEFGRFWRRLFGVPTAQQVPVCIEDRSSTAAVEQTASPEAHVIVVSVRGHVPCLKSQVSQLALAK